MAARCSEGEPARPAGSELFPELVPTPAAQGSGKPATPDLPAPSRSEAPPGKAAENVGPQIPSPDKQPVPARKEPAPAQEKPADKPADPVPPLMLDHSTGPITAAPGATVSNSARREPGGAVRSDSHLFLHPQPTAAGIFCGFRPAAQRQRPGPGEPVAEVTPYSGSSGFRCERRKTLAGVPPLGGFVAEIPPKGGTPARSPLQFAPKTGRAGIFSATLSQRLTTKHTKKGKTCGSLPVRFSLSSLACFVPFVFYLLCPSCIATLTGLPCSKSGLDHNLANSAVSSPTCRPERASSPRSTGARPREFRRRPRIRPAYGRVERSAAVAQEK